MYPNETKEIFMYTEQMTQKLSVIDVLNSQSVTNASVNSTVGVDMQKFRRVMFVIQCGSLGAAGTLDGRLQSSASSTFASGVHNISGTNLTQITANNALATIEITADQVNFLNNGDRYVRLNLTGGGNAITIGALALATDGDQKPENKQDLNTTYLSQRVVVS
jgi:hypothetical protein